MKSAIKVESKIQSFLARKVDKYPEFNQSITRLYRDLLREEHLEHGTYQHLSGEAIDLSHKPSTGRFATNHFRGWHYAP